MERFFKKIPTTQNIIESDPIDTSTVVKSSDLPSKKRRRIETNLEDDCHPDPDLHKRILDDFQPDPGLRRSILDFHPNDRDNVRRRYLLTGPYQPIETEFKPKKCGQQSRRFNPTWYKKHGTWLEYSLATNKAYCLRCYLFRSDTNDQQGGDCFVKGGFDNWKQALERFTRHEGKECSAHNEAVLKCNNLMRQDDHIDVAFVRQSDEVRASYRIRLNASFDCVEFLLRQGLSFRGHDESEGSKNQGNYLQLVHFLANHCEEVKKVTFSNAPGNCQLVSPMVQKDITNCFSLEISNVIKLDIGDRLFTILVDESRDVSMKEQMAMVLRYVDKSGSVVERFVGIIHVRDTSAKTLKASIETLLGKYSLNLSRVRGQGYDGASNMQGKYNGLKSLIMKENESAYYIHCFAHQLQLALVGMAQEENEVGLFFTSASQLVNIVAGSCKRVDILKEKHFDKVIEELTSGHLESGRGLNQETNLQRAGDTRWGSHYGSLIRLIQMFDPIIDVLNLIVDEGNSTTQKNDAYGMLDRIQSFEFVFILHLMRNVLGVTNDLSQALQRKDQDIVNAMKLVKLCKESLQHMRDTGWDSLLQEVTLFCETYKIIIPDMNDDFLLRGRPRRNFPSKKYSHHYRIDLFYGVIDKQLQELNNRFDEVNTELLSCVACLNPDNSFSAFDKTKLIRLAEFYPRDFSNVELGALEFQLDNFISDMKSENVFMKLKGIGDLAKKMVESKKDQVYPLIYRLLTLVLILPIATASVERCFSSMNIVKNRLRNRMGDEWMNDCLVTYIEKELLCHIDRETLLQRYQKMSNRREQL